MKQNVNQLEKLYFHKSVVTELNENQLIKVVGGTITTGTISCSFCISSSNGNWTREELFQNQEF